MQNFLLSIILLILFTLFGQKVSAQSGAYVTLNTQAEVDAYGEKNQTVVEYLILSGEDITDLSPLASLTEIEFFLGVFNTSLTSLKGLDNVTSILFSFIKYNSKLINLEGFSNLQSGANYEIENNAKLESLQGLNSLITLDSIEIIRNPNLADCTSICNLPSLTSKLIYGNTLECTNNKVVDNYCNPSSSNIRLSTQKEIDDFKTTYNDLRTISGYLQIVESPGNNDPIRNLDGLNELISIEDGLIIQNTSKLTNLDGLGNLITIGNSLDIHNNEKLQNTDSLADLGSTNLFYIIVTNNALLTSLSGFDQVNDIETVVIRKNAALKNFDILSNLKEAENIHITENSGLETVTFPELNKVTDAFLIDQNSALVDLNGLAKLHEVENFYIQNCPILESFIGLISFDTASLVFIKNTGVETLSGLEDLNTVGSFRIHENSNLSMISGLDNTIVDNLDIYNNEALVSINFDNLRELSALEIRGNNKLVYTSFNDLETLDYLNVFNNNTLSSLFGFQNLTSITSAMRIVENPSLIALDGLHNLNEVGYEATIFGNTALEDFCALGLLVTTDSDFILNATSNAYNPSKVEIANNQTCKSPSLSVDTIISDGPSENEIQIYPNPASDLLKIYMTSNSASYDLIAINGQLVDNGKLEKGENEIVVEDLKKGVYFAKLQEEGKSMETYKVILK